MPTIGWFEILIIVGIAIVVLGPLHVVAHRLGHRDAMVPATIYAHIDTEPAESASETFATRMRGN